MDEEYHINYFIKPIYDRKHRKFNFKERKQFKKFCQELRKTSPNYNMLVEIYYFIQVLSNVFFYSNSPKQEDCILFHNKQPIGNPTYSFCIRRNSLCITYNLWDNGNVIEVIKSNDIKDPKSPAARFKFAEGESVINNIDEENMFINIITITMDAVEEVFRYYWKNKFRGY